MLIYEVNVTGIEELISEHLNGTIMVLITFICECSQIYIFYHENLDN